MSPVNLNEKILADAGGWQAMKEARALLEMGRVASANYSAPVLKGLVREGDTEFRAGLKINSATDIENICSCRESRQWGKICAHSLAVGLAVVRPKMLAADAVAAASKAIAPGRKSGPQFSASSQPNLKLNVILPPNFEEAWEKDRIMVVVEAESQGGRLLLQALDSGKTFTCSQADLRVIEKIRELNEGALAGMMILSKEKCLEMLSALKGHTGITFGRTAKADAGALLTSHSSTGLDMECRDPGVETALLSEPEFSLTIEGSLNHLGARLQCIYGKRILFAGSRDRGGDFPGRNPKSEEKALQMLANCGFSGPDSSNQYILRGETRILAFFARDLPRLQSRWKVSIGARFGNITEEIERISPRINIQGSGESWFDMTVELATPEGQQFSAIEIQRLLQMGQNHVRLKNGKIAVFDTGMLDELQSVLMDCDPQQKQPGTYRVDRKHAGYIDAVIGEKSRIEGQGAATWQNWARSQRQLAKLEPIPLGDLENVLRPYQKDGVYWMSYLAKNRFGGILADEMGLGKTLQAIAIIHALGGISIVICPSSLIYNWKREAEKFISGINVLCIEGSNRQGLFNEIKHSNLVITSYPLLRRDIDKYRGFEFKAAILDEAQHIKNPDTQNAQAALLIRAENRFVLTGTPMENSVRDLWSIMNYLMPGYLGTRTDFRDRYEQPIVRDNSEETRSRLAKRLRPFMLRRIKKEVLTEIPEKIEHIAYCQLTTQQKEVYGKLLSSAKSEIERVSNEKSVAQGRVVMLTALLRLRQVCCDLRLLGVPGTVDEVASAKVDLLDELLQEAIDGGHRILIFSQFVSMLKILREHFDRGGLKYCYLDGQTKNRLEVVDQFQQDNDIPAFLISLKAGGVGLNLTGADTVIHFDPWWNPAVEAQATDRAHRIGQKRVVTSYKLIAKDTVEEKILTLQRKKMEMIDAMVDSDDQPLMTGLTMDEIMGLLD